MKKLIVAFITMSSFGLICMSTKDASAEDIDPCGKCMYSKCKAVLQACGNIDGCATATKCAYSCDESTEVCIRRCFGGVSERVMKSFSKIIACQVEQCDAVCSSK